MWHARTIADINKVLGLRCLLQLSMLLHIIPEPFQMVPCVKMQTEDLISVKTGACVGVLLKEGRPQ